MIGGKSRTILKVPKPILRQLIRRFEESHKTRQTFTDHANWLEKKGYPVPRSIVHKFCQRLRELKAANPDSEDILDLYLDEAIRSKICL
jgi:hypothetical protein